MARLKGAKRTSWQAVKHIDQPSAPPPQSEVYPVQAQPPEVSPQIEKIQGQVENSTAEDRSPSPVKTLDFEHSPNLPSTVEGSSELGGSPVIVSPSPVWAKPPRPTILKPAPIITANPGQTSIFPINVTGQDLFADSPIFNIRDSMIAPSASASRIHSPTRRLVHLEPTMEENEEIAAPQPQIPQSATFADNRTQSSLSHYHSLSPSPSDDVFRTVVPPPRRDNSAQADPRRAPSNLNRSATYEAFDLPGGYHGGLHKRNQSGGSTHVGHGASAAVTPRSRLRSFGEALGGSTYATLSPRDSPVPWDHEAEAARPVSPPAQPLAQQLLAAAMAGIGQTKPQPPRSISPVSILSSPNSVAPDLPQSNLSPFIEVDSLAGAGDKVSTMAAVQPPMTDVEASGVDGRMMLNANGVTRAASPSATSTSGSLVNITPQGFSSVKGTAPFPSSPITQDRQREEPATAGNDHVALGQTERTSAEESAPKPMISTAMDTVMRETARHTPASGSPSSALAAMVKSPAPITNPFSSFSPTSEGVSQQLHSRRSHDSPTKRSSREVPPLPSSPKAAVTRGAYAHSPSHTAMGQTQRPFAQSPTRNIGGSSRHVAVSARGGLTSPSSTRSRSPTKPTIFPSPLANQAHRRGETWSDLSNPISRARRASSEERSMSVNHRAYASEDNKAALSARSKSPPSFWPSNGLSGSSRHDSLPNRFLPYSPARETAAARTIDSVMGLPGRAGNTPAPFGLSEGYLRDYKEVSAILKSLRTDDTQWTLNVPHVVTIGSVSAGKSTLLESLTGLSLPRGPGSCTRCPVEYHLRNSSSRWSYHVQLYLREDESGEQLEQELNIAFGQPIMSKVQLEGTLRKAQSAILQPWIPPETIALARTGETSSASPDGRRPPLDMSANAIIVNISGPEVPDVIVYDLPGIPDANEDTQALSKRIAERYISRPYALILLVISCEHDLTQQAAFRFIAQKDELRDNVIGVLTHPESIPSEDLKNWADMLSSRHPLRHGWFCVKLSAASHKYTPTLVEAAEEKFFGSDSWKPVVTTVAGRLGLPKLANHIGGLIEDMMHDQLPDILHDVKNVLSEVREQMVEPPLTDATTEVLRDVGRFTDNIRRVLDGEVSTIWRPFSPVKMSRSGIGEENSGRSTAWDRFDAELDMTAALQDSYVALKQAITATAPRFRPLSSSDPNTPIASNSGRGTAQDANNNPIRAMTPRAQSPEHGRSLSRSASFRSLEGGRYAARDDHSDGRSSSPLDGADGPYDMNVDDVLAVAPRSQITPGDFPRQLVRSRLIQMIVCRWRDPCFATLHDIRASLTDVIGSLIQTHFGDYHHQAYMSTISEVVADLIDRKFKATWSALEKQLTVEARPFTQNTDLLQSTKAKYLAQYQDIRRRAEGLEPLARKLHVAADMDQNVSGWTFQNDVQTALTALRKLGIENVMAGDLAKLLPQDPHEPVLDVMADVRAYHHVASLRVCDTIPQTIEAHFILDLDTDVKEALMARIFCEGSRERCQAWISGPTEHIPERGVLQQQETLLFDVQQRLENLIAI